MKYNLLKKFINPAAAEQFIELHNSCDLSPVLCNKNPLFNHILHRNI